MIPDLWGRWIGAWINPSFLSTGNPFLGHNYLAIWSFNSLRLAEERLEAGILVYFPLWAQFLLGETWHQTSLPRVFSAVSLSKNSIWNSHSIFSNTTGMSSTLQSEGCWVVSVLGDITCPPLTGTFIWILGPDQRMKEICFHPESILNNNVNNNNKMLPKWEHDWGWREEIKISHWDRFPL